MTEKCAVASFSRPTLFGSLHTEHIQFDFLATLPGFSVVTYSKEEELNNLGEMQCNDHSSYLF